MTNNTMYRIGVITGFAATMLICLAIRWIIQKKTNASGSDYDERQLAARGRAAQWGFWVTIFYMLMIGIIKPRGLETDSLMFLGACLGLGVFGCICIIRDAYFPVSSQSPSKIVLIISVLIIAAISNLSLGLYHPENTVNLLNLMLGIMLAIILLVLLGKLIYDKKKEDDHEA